MIYKMNNTIFVAIMVLLASLCIFNKNTVEGFMGISGTNARHAYLPQSYKNNMNIRNFQPHGSTQTDNVKQLETFNYNPKRVRNNINEVEKQYKMIENYQRKNMNSRKSYNTRSSPNNINESFIPNRKDYELSRGFGVSSVTPSGYRNGARPSFGANMLRGELFGQKENYMGFSTANITAGRDRQNPICELTGSCNVDCSSCHGSGSGGKYSPGCEKCKKSGTPQQQYVPKANRRGNNANVPQTYMNKLVAPESYKSDRFPQRRFKNKHHMNKSKIPQTYKNKLLAPQ
jgi:hypothetical protein